MQSCDEVRADQNTAAAQRSCQPQYGVRLPEKSRLLCQGDDVYFHFVAKHLLGGWSVNLMCAALGVSGIGLYTWLVGPLSQRSLSGKSLTSPGITRLLCQRPHLWIMASVA